MPDATMGDVFRAIQGIRREMPQMAWMLDIPEVARLLIKLQTGEIDRQNFQFQLGRTRWWRQTSSAQQQWHARVSWNPAEARAQRRQMTETVTRLLAELGVNARPGQIRAQGGRRDNYRLTGATAAARIADLALYNGWDENQVQRYILSLSSWADEGEDPSGGIATTMTQLRRLAEQYGLDPRDRRLFRASRQILSGRQTLDGFEEELRQQAITRYGGNEDIAGVLDRGGNLDDWFDPYRRMIAEELEIPDAEISINDPRWQSILMHDDGTRARSMTMAEALKFVRSQPEWASTMNGKRQEAGLTQTLLRTFGARA